MSPRTVDTPWFTQTEAAVYCRVSDRQFRRWIESKRVVGAGTPKRFHRDVLDAAVIGNELPQVGDTTDAG